MNHCSLKDLSFLSTSLRAGSALWFLIGVFVVAQVNANMLERASASRDFDSSAMTASGYAVINIQNGQSHAQRRVLAVRASKLDAYRNLAEQIYGVFIESTSHLDSMKVDAETLRGRVQGLIYGSKIVQIKPVGDDTYETIISIDRPTVEKMILNWSDSMAAKDARRGSYADSKRKKQEKSGRLRWDFVNRKWTRNG